MGRTILLDKMKKIDNIFLVCLVLLLGCFVALYFVGELNPPTYFIALFLGVNIVMLLYIIINKRQKQNLKKIFEASFKAAYFEEYTEISKDEENEVYFLVNTLLDEVAKSRVDIKVMLKLVSALEKDELNNFSEKSTNKNVNNAIKTLKSLENENANNRKITTEFFKNFKTGKFNDIDIDSENIVQQQLNTILHSMYVMNTNLRIVQSAIFQGVQGVELETEGVEGDFLNVTNKLTTMLKSIEKASANLNKGILMIDEKGLEDFIQSAYKGNLVESFKAVEIVYENLIMSIDNIVYSLENNTKIDYDNVSELFNPIINVINSSEFEIHFENQDEKVVENKKANFKEIKRYNTISLDLINDIENSLKSIQSTFDTSDLALAKAEKETEVSTEVKAVSEVEETVETEAVSEVKETVEIEEVEEVSEVEETVEAEEVEAVSEVEETVKTEEVKEVSEVEETIEPAEAKEVKTVENKQEAKVNDFRKREKNKKYRPNNSGNSLRTNTQNDRFKSESTNNRGGVNRLNETNKDKAKKPLTYQEALRSGRVEETTSNNTRKTEPMRTLPTRNTATTRTMESSRTTIDKSKKEPMTYQMFLDKGNRPTDSNNEDKRQDNRTNQFESNTKTERVAQQRIGVNNTPTREARKPETASTRSRFKEGALQEIDPTKKRTKLEENLGRKLSQKERTELDLYGEILDDKTRAKMDIITDGKDLGGF